MGWSPGWVDLPKKEIKIVDCHPKCKITIIAVQYNELKVFLYPGFYAEDQIFHATLIISF